MGVLSELTHFLSVEGGPSFSETYFALLCLKLHVDIFLCIFCRQNILSGIPSVSNSLDPNNLIIIMPHIFSGLIWVQTVCKGYLQMTLHTKR